jgi:hypothetical protein
MTVFPTVAIAWGMLGFRRCGVEIQDGNIQSTLEME